jgi:hypothetical protein
MLFKSYIVQLLVSNASLFNSAKLDYMKRKVVGRIAFYICAEMYPLHPTVSKIKECLAKRDYNLSGVTKIANYKRILEEIWLAAHSLKKIRKSYDWCIYLYDYIRSIIREVKEHVGHYSICEETSTQIFGNFGPSATAVHEVVDSLNRKSYRTRVNKNAAADMGRTREDNSQEESKGRNFAADDNFSSQSIDGENVDHNNTVVGPDLTRREDVVSSAPAPTTATEILNEEPVNLTEPLREIMQCKSHAVDPQIFQKVTPSAKSNTSRTSKVDVQSFLPPKKQKEYFRAKVEAYKEETQNMVGMVELVLKLVAEVHQQGEGKTLSSSKLQVVDNLQKKIDKIKKMNEEVENNVVSSEKKMERELSGIAQLGKTARSKTVFLNCIREYSQVLKEIVVSQDDEDDEIQRHWDSFFEDLSEYIISLMYKILPLLNGHTDFTYSKAADYLSNRLLSYHEEYAGINSSGIKKGHKRKFVKIWLEGKKFEVKHLYRFCEIIYKQLDLPYVKHKRTGEVYLNEKAVRIRSVLQFTAPWNALTVPNITNNSELITMNLFTSHGKSLFFTHIGMYIYSLNF